MPKTYDLTGMRFGRLTVLCESPNRLPNTRCKVWECRCDCGNICYVSTSSLRSGNKKSCGCIHKQKYPSDLSGIIFGALTAIERAPDHITPSGQKNIMWKCRCKCGKYVAVYRSNLIQGYTKSCGCMLGSNISARTSRASSEEIKRRYLETEQYKKTRKLKYESVLKCDIENPENVIHLNCDMDDFSVDNLWYNPNASTINNRLLMLGNIPGCRNNYTGRITTDNPTITSCALMFFRLVDEIRRFGGTV